MLSAADYPPNLESVADWFALHAAEWQQGKAFRFSIFLDDAMIGLTDLEIQTAGEASLGYWIERSAWGQGLATEAAGAVLRFGFGVLGLNSIKAGHAADNTA